MKITFYNLDYWLRQLDTTDISIESVNAWVEAKYITWSSPWMSGPRLPQTKWLEYGHSRDDRHHLHALTILVRSGWPANRGRHSKLQSCPIPTWRAQRMKLPVDSLVSALHRLDNLNEDVEYINSIMEVRVSMWPWPLDICLRRSISLTAAFALYNGQTHGATDPMAYKTHDIIYFLGMEIETANDRYSYQQSLHQF